MSADFNPLDTSQRQKVLDIVNQLANAGLSDADIQRYFQGAESQGQQALQQYYNSAGLALGQQFSPQFEQAQNRLGASPLLANSGYANRLNAQLQSDLYARLAGQYGGAASNMAEQNVGFLRNLYGQKIGQRGALLGAAYQTMTTRPKRQRWYQQAISAGGQLLGAGVGALSGRGGGGAAQGDYGASGGMGGYDPTYGYDPNAGY